MSNIARNTLLAVIVAMSALMTVGVAFGGLRTWEVYVWVWLVPVWAYNWWRVQR